MRNEFVKGGCTHTQNEEKMRIQKYFAIALLAVYHAPSSALANNVGEQAVSEDRYVRMKMREHIGHDPLLEIIAGCESTGDPNRIQHWKPNGHLVKNPDSSASGALQILLIYHRDWIEDEGHNMANIDEYMQFARTLFEAQGYAAWNASRSCWDGYSHLAQNS